jgi:hypothetical protein
VACCVCRKFLKIELSFAEYIEHLLVCVYDAHWLPKQTFASSPFCKKFSEAKTVVQHTLTLPSGLQATCSGQPILALPSACLPAPASSLPHCICLSRVPGQASEDDDAGPRRRNRRRDLVLCGGPPVGEGRQYWHRG